MSPCDVTSTLSLETLAKDLAELVREMEQGIRHDVTKDDLSSAIGSIAKILASAHASGVESALNPDFFTVTEAVIMIEFLMEAQNVNSFDLAMWISRAKNANGGH